MSPGASDWRPTTSLAHAKQRARLLRAARDFFERHGILEVDTPALTAAAVSDPNLESIAVTLQADPSRSWFLHTSPEFAMKRLLAAGWPDIYQVCKVFRDGEHGPRHQPEFTMIEWYRLGISFDDMMSHTVDFLQQLLGGTVTLAAPRYLGYAEAFREHAGLDPLIASVQQLREASGADSALANSLGDRRDDWLDLLLSTRVAPAFATDQLTVLHHFPASQAALADYCAADRRVADRYEVFLGETELANGYRELTNAAEQERRFHADQETRAASARPLRPLDSDLLAALGSGLPECCGVAVGFDRLLMLAAGTPRLADVQSFTVLREHHD